MLCSVFAWIICPLFLIISSVKIAQTVKQWIRKRSNNIHKYRYTGSNPTRLLCFAIHNIIFHYCTAVQLTVSSWLIIMDIQHRFLNHTLTIRYLLEKHNSRLKNNVILQLTCVYFPRTRSFCVWFEERSLSVEWINQKLCERTFSLYQGKIVEHWFFEYNYDKPCSHRDRQL